ncbi:MAG: Eco57I restriction-modification methylase domain-containing protein [Promethearchaeota archaeon]
MKSSNKKESLGTYYTPTILAQFVVWSAFQQFFHQRLPKKLLLKFLSQVTASKIPKDTINYSTRLQMQELIKDIKILDLGVGNGVFLLEAGKFLEAIHCNSSDSTDVRFQIIQNNLHGVDFNPKAIHTCQKELKKWLLGQNESNLTQNKLKEVQNTLNHQIRHGNVLLGSTKPEDQKRFLELLQKEELSINENQFFHWYKEFPRIFNHENKGFNLVLCNPPYVTKDISSKDNQIYRQLYQKQIFINRFNLYHLFLTRVNELLTSDGIATFLTSNSVLTDYYSVEVRKFLLSQFHLREVVDFVSRTHIFPNVLQGTCLLVLQKKKGGEEKEQTHIIRTCNIEELVLGEITEGDISTPLLLFQDKIIPSPYPKTFEIIRLIRKNSICLKDVYKIQSGEIRPADSKIRPFYYKKILEKDNISNFEIVLNGKNVHPFIINLSENRHKPRWYLQPSSMDNTIFRKKHANTPRIVFQRITAREQLRRVVSGLISEDHLKTHNRIWVENNLNYFLLDCNSTSIYVSTNLLLGIFNSLLINWFIHQINLTAAVPPADIGLIPLPRLNPLKNDICTSIEEEVSSLSKSLEQFSSSKEIFLQLCPFCTEKGKISELCCSLDDLIFELYRLPDLFKKEVIKQLETHHKYFNHH